MSTSIVSSTPRKDQSEHPKAEEKWQCSCEPGRECQRPGSIVRLGSVPNKNDMTAGVAVAYVAMLASLFMGRPCMPLFSALHES